MARYKIYDNKSDVITPVGEKLTAEQWLDRYQWGRYTKMIVGGGIINGFQDKNTVLVWSVTARRAAISVPAPPTRTIWPPSRRSRITLPWQTPASPTRPALRMLWKTWWR